MNGKVTAVVGGFVIVGLAVIAAADRAVVMLAHRTPVAAVTVSLAPLPVRPLIEVRRTNPLTALLGDSSRPAQVPTVIAPPPPESTREGSPAAACLFGGLAGAGTALVIGPTEIGALVVGAALVPATAPVIGMVLGGAFVAGCGSAALLTPRSGPPP